MDNLEWNSRKRTLNPKLSSTDNVSQEAANLKRQKLQKGAITATISKNYQASVQDSDEEEEYNIPKQSQVGQPKNPKADEDSDNVDVEMLDGDQEASMPASSVINISKDEDGVVVEEESHEAKLGIFFWLSSAYLLIH